MALQVIEGAAFAGALFVGVLLCCQLGWRLGRKRLRNAGEDVSAGLGAVEGAVFALMGLLIAFTFTSAAARFDHRRDLIVEEVNAIGTAWLRLDLLDAQARDDVRGLFRQYLDARMDTYAHAGEAAETAADLSKTAQLQAAIWARLIEAMKSDPSQRLEMPVLSPVNQMFDIANERVLATRQHPPLAIYLMLGLLVLVSAVLSGFGMAKSASLSRLHLLGFAAIVSLAVYFIIDLDYPRLGLIRVDAFDRALIELRASMN